MRHGNGYTLVDGMVAVALLALAALVAIPNLERARRNAGLEGICRTLAATAHLCRLRALNAGRNAGLVFVKAGGRWSFTPAIDGDGDGVSRRDVERGIDQPMGPTVRLEALCQGATIGVPAGWRVPNPTGRGWLRAGDGLAAGRSDIISFSATGDATPATVYVNDGRSRLLAVRVYGGTARVRVLEWRAGWTAWRRLAI